MVKEKFDAVMYRLVGLTLFLAPAIYLASRALPSSSDSVSTGFFVLWTEMCVWVAMSYCKETSISALLEAAQKTTNSDGGR